MHMVIHFVECVLFDVVVGHQFLENYNYYMTLESMQLLFTLVVH